MIGAGGVGRLTLTVNGIEVAAGHTDVPADPVEAMVRPGEIRATVYLAAGREAEIGISLRPDDWPQGPVAIRLGLVPAPDDDTMLSQAVEAARAADAAVVVVGSGPASESEGFDRPGLALPGRQDELVRRVAAVNDRTIVVVNAGDAGAHAVGGPGGGGRLRLAAGPGDGRRAGRRTARSGRTGGQLPVTIPAAEADCPVLHSVPAEGRLEYREGLLIGYRGYDHAGAKPHFPFGHGLGYTTWAYESAAADAPVAPPDGDLGVTVVLRNTGPGPGARSSRPTWSRRRRIPATGARAGRLRRGHRGAGQARRGQAHVAGPGICPLRRGGRDVGLGPPVGRVHHPHRPVIGRPASSPAG